MLGKQDRGRWGRALIAEGQAVVRRCLRRNQPGLYQLQATINAVHADAASVERTDRRQILTLDDQLLAVAPTPVVALNRAVAVAEAQAPAAALALVDELELSNYYPFHATRADLLRRLGRDSEAAAVYERAAAMAPTDAEREFLGLGGRGAESERAVSASPVVSHRHHGSVEAETRPRVLSHRALRRGPPLSEETRLGAESARGASRVRR